MKKYILITLTTFILILQISCKEEIISFDGQNSSSVTINWQNSFGGKDFDDISSIIKTSDGGYMAVGSSLSSDWDYWVLKFDADFNLLWERKFGGTNADFGKCIVETESNNYVIAGYSNSTDGNITLNKGGYDIWIIKISSEGVLVWQKNYGGTGSETITEESILTTNLGGYVFSATTTSDDYDVIGQKGGADIWLVNINDTSEIVWAKTYGGADDDFSNRIKYTPDGSYMLSNIVQSVGGDILYNYDKKDIWLARINSSGDIMWQKTIGGTGTESQCDITMTSDGGIIVMTQTSSKDGEVQKNYGNKDIWFSKIDATGNIVWNTIFGGSLDENSGEIIQLSDGGYLASISSNSIDYFLGFNYGKKDICLIKLSETGTIEWTKIFGGTDDEYSNSLLELSSNSILVTANSKSEDFDITKHIGGFDFWLFTVNY